ncbi:MAG: helix-turn-helix transcriptional regulator [Bacilli bacterium]
MVDNKDLARQYNIFSNNVRYFRKRKILTQEQLAEQCDLSTSYIKQIESNKEFKNVSLMVILKISKILEIPINELFILKDH